MTQSNILTHCISTYNNLPYLRLAIESVRKNSYYKDAPFIIHAENCTDGTNEWLEEHKDTYNLTTIIEPNNKVVRGIGGGMNICAEHVQTKYVNFLHSDFYVTENWDLELLKIHEKHPTEKLWVNSHRVEPNMFNSAERPGTIFVPLNAFGAYYDDFEKEAFEEWAKEVTATNDFEVPKGEGVSGLVLKEVWDAVGGNDPRFAPTSWDDMDLFIRMLQHGVRFVLPIKSLVWHFGARGSHRLEENGGQTSQRQRDAEYNNARKWLEKWGKMPTFDQYGMIKPWTI